MVDTQIQAALIDALGQMSVPAQNIVLDVALRLANPGEPTPGTPFGQLKHLVGTLPAEIADQMQQAIDEDCERVDVEQW